MLAACASLGMAGDPPAADPPPPPGVELHPRLPPAVPAPKERASTWVFRERTVRYTCDAGGLDVPGRVIRALFTAPTATGAASGALLLEVRWEQDGVETGRTRLYADGTVSTLEGAGERVEHRLGAKELEGVVRLLGELPEGC